MTQSKYEKEDCLSLPGTTALCHDMFSFATQPLNTLRTEVFQLQQEAESILSLASDLQLAHKQNKKAFAEFKLQ